MSFAPPRVPRLKLPAPGPAPGPSESENDLLTPSSRRKGSRQRKARGRLPPKKSPRCVDLAQCRRDATNRSRRAADRQRLKEQQRWRSESGVQRSNARFAGRLRDISREPSSVSSSPSPRLRMPKNLPFERRRLRQIEAENMQLLRRIENAKASVPSAVRSARLSPRRARSQALQPARVADMPMSARLPPIDTLADAREAFWKPSPAVLWNALLASPEPDEVREESMAPAA